MTASAGDSFEVDVEFLELTDPNGHRYFLKRGDALPAWVNSSHAADLEAAGNIFRFEVLHNA